MTQSFFVTEAQTGRPGKFVKLADTVNDVNDIVSGKYDQLAPEKMMFIGTLKEEKLT
jgi:F-type H+-transporting ATPase subunit beta